MSRTDDGAVRHHNAFAVAGLPDRTSRPDSRSDSSGLGPVASSRDRPRTEGYLRWGRYHSPETEPTDSNRSRRDS